MRLSRLGLRLGLFVGMLFGGEVSIMKLVVHSRPSGLAPCVGRIPDLGFVVIFLLPREILRSNNMSDFISLTCPSCGGKLKITPDIDRFACQFCGTEQIVKRGEGIISLMPVMDAIGQVKQSVDKTAAELSIIRLNKELDDLQARRDQILQANPIPALPNDAKAALFLGILLFITSCILLSQKDGTLYFCILNLVNLILFSYFGLIYMARKNSKYTVDTLLNPINTQINSKKEEINKAKSIVQ
jgi:hypothetical protein